MLIKGGAAKKTPEGHKFSITIGEIPDYPNETNLMTKVEYEEKYGPLTATGYKYYTDRFTYVDNPWPWEVEA